MKRCKVTERLRMRDMKRERFEEEESAGREEKTARWEENDGHRGIREELGVLHTHFDAPLRTFLID